MGTTGLDPERRRSPFLVIHLVWESQSWAEEEEEEDGKQLLRTITSESLRSSGATWRACGKWYGTWLRQSWGRTERGSDT